MKLKIMPDVFGIQAGSLADPSRFVPAMDVFTGRRAALGPHAPRAEEFPAGICGLSRTDAPLNWHASSE